MIYKWWFCLWSPVWGNVCQVTTTTTKSLQSCPTLFHPTDSSPPGSPVPGILQARTLEWVAISFSNFVRLTLSKLPQFFPSPNSAHWKEVSMYSSHFYTHTVHSSQVMFPFLRVEYLLYVSYLKFCMELVSSLLFITLFNHLFISI